MAVSAPRPDDTPGEYAPQDDAPRPDEMPGGVAFQAVWDESVASAGDNPRDLWNRIDHAARERVTTAAAVARRRIAEQVEALGYESLEDLIEDNETAWHAAVGRPLAHEAWAAEEAEFAGEPLDRENGPLVPLSAIDRSPAPPLVIDRIDSDGHTILYGTGDVGKGTIASSWIAQLVASGKKVLILDYENHPNEWARRIGALLRDPDLDRQVWWAGPLRHDWPGRRGPIWDQAKSIRKFIETDAIDMVVVDSIVPACGGADVMEPGAPGRYAGALQYLGVPVLSIAHVTKADELRYPFGSVFWHNLARVTWSLNRAAGGRLELVNRKSNNHEKAGRFEVTVTWQDDELREVWERGYSAALADRIADVLGDEASTVGQIVRRLNEECDDGETEVKDNSVRTALRRHIGGLAPRFTVDGTGPSATFRKVS